jgi:hypothetical protein
MNAKLVIVLLLACVYYSSAAETCPGVDMTALRAEREEVVYIWASKTNIDQQHLRDVFQQHTTEDSSDYPHAFIIDSFGRFDGRLVAEEYAILAVDPLVFQLFTFADPVSFRWEDSNEVWYKAVTNYTFNFLPGKPEYDGFVNDAMIRFAPCTAKVWISYTRQDPLVARAIVSSERNLTPTQVCTVIQSACTGEWQVYESQAACEEYIGALSDSPCPSGQLTNTSNCYFFHGTAAVYLPEVHCAHVRPWYSPDGPSDKCVDFCLTEGCGNCHEDAHCEFTTPLGELASSYACVCNDGYTGDGVTHCVEKSCSADYQCPSDTPFVDCDEELCTCIESFNWDSSDSAANAHSACACGLNQNLLWTNGVPECVPIGRCREGHREDCTGSNGPHTWNTVTCGEFGSNVLLDHLYKTCLCNYGYDNPGFANACECSAPKREVWDPLSAGNICITDDQCTQNWHCASNSCTIGIGDVVGSCDN